MSLGLIIAGWALAVVAASTLVWHRRRERRVRFAWAREHGLDLYQGRPRELAQRLRSLTLMQVGHSRRIETAFVLPGGGYAFSYRCHTGFDQERYLHGWLVAAVEVQVAAGRAVITAQDWLRSAAHATSRRELSISRSPANGAIVIVEDAEAWQSHLNGELGRWLQNQSSVRSWEVLPGWIAGYEPGVAEGPPLLDLAAATKELAGLLAKEPSALDAAAPKS